MWGDGKKIKVIVMKKNNKMSADDVAKLKAVALYVLDKCGETDFIHLFKIIYFAERKIYAKYGQHLVKDTFVAMEHGPVPSNLYDALKLMNGKGNNKSVKSISDSLLPAGGECAWFFVKSSEKPDMDELSKAEVEALDEAIARYKDVDAKTLSEMSHDIAWHAAWDKSHNTQMSPLDIAKAGEASDEFLRYLAEQEMLNPYLPACRKELHYLLKATDYDFLEGEDRFVDCSDFKKISKERFADLFSAEKQKGKINQQDVKKIKDLICSYENVSMKMLWRFGLM